MGEQCTIADAYLFTVLSWGTYVKLDIDRWPQLKRYVERVGAPGCHRGVRGRKTAGIASSTEVERLAELVGLGTPAARSWI